MLGLRMIIAAVAVLSVSGCMTVQTQVDAYSTIPTDLEPRTVYIAPFRGMSAQTLQWQTNAGILAAVLAERGFEVVGRQRDARLTAYFGFAIDQGEQVQTVYSIPQYGVTGYSGAHTYGSVYGNTYSATTTFTPTYGITGYSSGVSTSIVYTRSLAIEMIDNRNQQLVFEARAVSRGNCGSFTPVASSIIQAVLSNFPEGRTGLVSTPMEGEC